MPGGLPPGRGIRERRERARILRALSSSGPLSDSAAPRFPGVRKEIGGKPSGLFFSAQADSAGIRLSVRVLAERAGFEPA